MASRDDETDLDTGTPSDRGGEALLMWRAPGRTDAIRIEEGRTIIVGRGSEAGLVIDDAKASRAHLSIRLRAGVLFLEDLGGRNGTRVNDRVIRGESVVLRSGDRIFVGDTEIVAVVPERRIPGDEFLEIELAQMLATLSVPVSLVRVAFPHPAPDDLLDEIDGLVGDRGVVVQRSDREIYLLLPTALVASTSEEIGRAATEARLSTADHPADGRTAKELARTCERRAGASSVGRPGVIVADRSMIELYRLVDRVATAPTTVLLLGETGVGKELVAEAIHRQSPRRDGPLVKVNCGALPESLLESELFGHERGAFTGADRTKIGLFEAADQGTIFLDEIGEMTLPAQVRLLRVLEARAFTRVGGTVPIAVDVRVVCATHRDLLASVSEGGFRQDLYYRIATTVLRVPPLRDRSLELPLLAGAFAEEAAARMGMDAPTLDPEVLSILVLHPFAGNVRELRNAMEHAVVLSGGGWVRPEHLPETLRPPRSASSTRPVREHVADAEKVAILEALEKTGGNRTHAAALLGISRRTLVYRLARYGIGRDR
jgi:two-component system, NtrC family, response regulator AtoC